jgi:hypothetical protein
VVLDRKLRATAKALKKWSDKWIGNIKLQIAIALEVILRLDMAMDTRPLTIQECGLRKLECGLRKLLKKKLLGLCSLERSIARQRSRLLFLRDGDASTKFFHAHARHRQRRNTITSLRHENNIASSHEDLGNMVDNFYDQQLGDAPTRNHSINLDAIQLPYRDLSHLEVLFIETEVEKVVKAMPLDKAWGPDGFTGSFYASCWQVIKVEIMRAFDLFFQGDMRGLPAINKAIVSLLPKVDGALDLEDFRPVSLIHGAVKI